MSVSAIAVLGVTNLLTPLSYASAATPYDSLSDAELKVKMLQFMMPDKHVYLKAYTEANKYFVHYDGNDETSGEMGDANGNQEFTYDTTGNLAPNAFAKTGYSFNEWKDGSGVSHANNAEVFNWTAVESGVVNVYAQWTANHYLIHYYLNDGTGSSRAVTGTSAPEQGTYNQDVTITHPSRTGYDFSGWNITNMDSEQHMLGDTPSSAISADNQEATTYRNLRADDGQTVNFTATWTAQKVAYTVNHILETLTTGVFSGGAERTDNLSGYADSEVTPNTGDFVGFTSPAKQTTGVKADGSTIVNYEYTRNSYALELNAGKGITSVTAQGPNSDPSTLTTTSNDSSSFKFEDTITLTYVVADGYGTGVWSGYNDGADTFPMPAEAISKTAYATPTVYTITYNYSGADTPTPNNPDAYTIESGSFTLLNPTRNHSKFEGWIGTDLGGATKTVTISGGSMGDKNYTATYSCLSGYKENSAQTACMPAEDTEYTVRHYFQNLDGTNTIENETLTGATESSTNAQPKDYSGFQAQLPINQEIITGDGSTEVHINYNRLKYETTVTPTAGVTVTHTGEYDSSNGNVHPNHQYGDKVTLHADMEDGYTFNSWTVTRNDNGAEVTVTDNQFTMPASAVTITPNVTLNDYTITYVLHEGTLPAGVDNPTHYTVESGAINLPTPTRDNGHAHFDGWRGISGTVEPASADPAYTLPAGNYGNKTYEAVWSCNTGYTADGDACVANTYKVTVDTMDGGNGGVSSGETLIFTYDDPTTIPNPTQSGYTFAGWTVSGHDPDTATVDGVKLTSPTSGTVFENLTPTSGATVTLVANWTPDSDTQYVVNYYVRDLGATTYTLTGTVTGHAETNTGITLATEAAKQTYEGFKYSSGYVGVGDTTRPTAGDVLTTTVDKYGNTVINLYFDRNKWHVYLTGDAHVNTVIGENDYDYGADVSVDMTAKEGYHFKEWKKKTAETFNSAD